MIHPNRPYPLYELPRIESLKHMLEMQARSYPDRISFRFRKGKEIVDKTAAGFYGDVSALGTWLLHHGIREKHIALIEGKKVQEEKKVIAEFPASGIQILNGRYGPYLKQGKENYKIPKRTDPATLTEADCQALIAKSRKK